MIGRRLLTLLGAAAVAVLPSLAQACPACAGRDDGNGLNAAYLLGTMILLPFGVAAIVFRVLKHVEREESALGETKP